MTNPRNIEDQRLHDISDDHNQNRSIEEQMQRDNSDEHDQHIHFHRG